MSAIVSIRLDDAARAMLETEAKERGLGLSVAIRDLACEAAKEAKRNASANKLKPSPNTLPVNPEAQEFFEFWGTPRVEL